MSGDHMDLKLERKEAKTISNTTNAATPQGKPPPSVLSRMPPRNGGGAGSTRRDPCLEMV